MANSALNKLKSKVNNKTLVGKQKNLDMNKNGKLDKEDFKILRGNKMAKGGLTDDQKEKLEYLKGQLEIANASFMKALKTGDKLRIKSAKKNYEDYAKDYNNLKYNYPLLKKILRDNGFETPKYGHSSIRGTRPPLNNHYEIPDKVSSPSDVRLYIKNISTVTTDKLIADLKENGYEYKSNKDFTSNGYYSINVKYMIDEDKMAKGGYMAKGGLTEHGLKIGDTIIDKGIYSIEVQNKETGNATVNLNTGQRDEQGIAKNAETYDKALFKKELNEFKKEIKEGYGWISPDYVSDSWENMGFKTNVSNFKSQAAQDLFKDLIDSGLLYHEEYEGNEEQGEKIESFRELYGWNYGENEEYAGGGSMGLQGKLEEMSEKYQEWLHKNNLPIMSADELLVDESVNLTNEQRKYIQNFSDEWEEEQDKYANGGETRKDIFVGDIVKYDGKEYQSKIGNKGWINFYEVESDKEITPINPLWEKIYKNSEKMKSNYAKGGMSQGYDDREDERLGMEHGKMSSKDLDSTHARRDDARFEERGKMAKGGSVGGQMGVVKSYWNKFDKKRRIEFLESAGYSKSVATDLSSESWDSLEKGVHKDLLSVIMADGGYMAKGGYYAEGGSIEKQNNDMLKSTIVEMKHHVDELKSVVSNNTEVEPWVIAKAERASTDLSDITHYLEGEKQKGLEMPFEKGGYMADGGELSGLTAKIYRSDYDSPINKMYGKNSVTIIDEQVPGIFQPNESRPAVRLIRRKFRFGSDEYEYIHAVPYDQSNNEGMFGGTFIYSSDSRFPSKYPIPLHDRVEMEKGGYMNDGGKVRNIDKIKQNIGEEVYESIKHSNKEQLEKWLKENLERISHSLKFHRGKKTLEYYKLKDEQWLILYRLERLDEFNYDDEVDYEKGGYMASGGMTPKDRKIAEQISKIYNKQQLVMTPADKANRFLEAVRVADNDIKLKDITVEASPRGNWVVFEHGKVIMTVNHDMLDEETIRTYNLEHHNS